MSRKSRRIAELQARVQQLQDAGGHQVVAEAQERLRVAARQYAALSDRFVALTTEARELRAQLEATQAQLDAALGMDDPGIAAGAGWQERRPDKAPPRAVAGRGGDRAAWRILARGRRADLDTVLAANAVTDGPPTP